MNPGGQLIVVLHQLVAVTLSNSDQSSHLPECVFNVHVVFRYQIGFVLFVVILF